MIVDSKNDLNIYTKSEEDEKSNRCCGAGSDSPCCERSQSCCNNAEPANSGAFESPKSDFKHIDFNEWAGMYYHVGDLLLCYLLTAHIGSFKVYAVKS